MLHYLKLPFIVFLILGFNANPFSQTGNFTITFTSPNNLIKPVTISFTKALFKYDNPHGYWFINPHNGSRHFNTMPEQGYGGGDAAFITINEKENDIDLYAGTSNDSNEVSISNHAYSIALPTWDPKLGDNNKPMHFHITTFTATEIAFTMSGTAQLVARNGGTPSLGTITGSAHFYREAQYLKSDVLPGCDCDPTIYGAVYDMENNIRTTSACENATYNKVFDAVRKSMAGLFSNIAYSGNGAMKAGEISIDMLPGCANINVPVKDRPYCSGDYYHNHLTGFDAQKKIFNQDDAYGLRLIKSAADVDINGGQTPESRKMVMDSMGALLKLMAAKKIDQKQYEKEMAGLQANLTQGQPDLKKAEVEHHLYIKILINPDDKESMLVKLVDKNKVSVQHNINGAAFEIFSPQNKDGSSDWIANRLNIYFGKYTAPALGKSGGGFDAEITNAIYPANTNKLWVYNVIIRMEGAKDLIDKAIANIDFSTIISLIVKQ